MGITITSVFQGASERTWNGSGWERKFNITVPVGTEILLLRIGNVMDSTATTVGGVATTQVLQGNDSNGTGVVFNILASPPTGLVEVVMATTIPIIGVFIDSIVGAEPIQVGSVDNGYWFNGAKTLSFSTIAEDVICDMAATSVEADTKTPGTGQAQVSPDFAGSRVSVKYATSTTTAVSWTRAGGGFGLIGAVLLTSKARGPKDSSQFYRDFSGDTLNQLPSDFALSYRPGAFTSVQVKDTADFGRVLSLVATNASGTRIVEWTTPGQPLNFELYFEAVPRAATRNAFGLTGRVQLLPATNVGIDQVAAYYKGAFGVGEVINSTRFNGESYESLASNTSALKPNNVKFAFRYRVNGSEHRLKSWYPATESEPLAWTLTGSSVNHVEAGFLGVMIEYETTKFDLVALSAGINGWPAPTSAPVTSPNTPINLGVINILANSVRLIWEKG
jgi:hypothetical protein